MKKSQWQRQGKNYFKNKMNTFFVSFDNRSCLMDLTGQRTEISGALKHKAAPPLFFCFALGIPSEHMIILRSNLDNSLSDVL